MAEGRIIVDPMVMEELIRTGDSGSGVVHELSPKEMEVLGGWPRAIATIRLPDSCRGT